VTSLDRVPVRCTHCDCTTYVSVSEARFGAECGSSGLAQQDEGKEQCGKYFDLSPEQKIEAILQWLDEL
jgi:hypothetical protein